MKNLYCVVCDKCRKIEKPRISYLREKTLVLSLICWKCKKSKVVSDSSDENNFPHKLLLTNTQILKLPKTYANGSSANTRLSKTLLHKIGQLEGFLDRLLEPLIKT